MAPFKYIRLVKPNKMFSPFIFRCVCPQQEVGGATIEHLSLLAHLSSLSLCHPPLTMVAPGDRQLPKLRPFLPLRTSLPCDIHLLNLRTLEDAQVFKNRKSLTLHISATVTLFVKSFCLKFESYVHCNVLHGLVCFIVVRNKTLLEIMQHIFFVFGKQEAGSPSQEVALLLHRKGFDCSSTPEPPLQCTWSAQQEVDTHFNVLEQLFVFSGPVVFRIPLLIPVDDVLSLSPGELGRTFLST